MVDLVRAFTSPNIVNNSLQKVSGAHDLTRVSSVGKRIDRRGTTRLQTKIRLETNNYCIIQRASRRELMSY